MSEGFIYNPSAEELYSDYRQAYFDLEEAKHRLPEVDSETRASIEHMDSIISSADIDPEVRQELLTKIAEAKDLSMKTRLKLQRLNIIVAGHALGSEEIIAADVYTRKKNEWHEEALAEDKSRNQQ